MSGCRATLRKPLRVRSALPECTQPESFVDRKLASSEPVWPRDELDLRRKSGWRARSRTLTREKMRALQAAPRNGIWYSRSCARRDWRNVRVPELQTEQNGRGRETGSAR